jgi:hypothetical protein
MPVQAKYSAGAGFKGSDGHDVADGQATDLSAIGARLTAGAWTARNPGGPQPSRSPASFGQQLPRSKVGCIPLGMAHIFPRAPQPVAVTPVTLP